MKIVGYKIVRSISVESMETMILELAEQGWELQGGVSMKAGITHQYIQAMVLPAAKAVEV